MDGHKSHLTIEELAEQVDIPVRTIRYYIAEGLLPGPEGRGKATTYGEEHLLRLRLIRLLSQQRMPLAEVSQFLNRLSLGEVQTLLAEEEQRVRELERASEPLQAQGYIATLLKNAQAVRRAAPQGPPVQSAPAPAPTPSQSGVPPGGGKVYEKPESYQRTPAQRGESWERWELAPGVELHVKEGAGEQHTSLLERIFQITGLAFPYFRK